MDDAVYVKDVTLKLLLGFSRAWPCTFTVPIVEVWNERCQRSTVESTCRMSKFTSWNGFFRTKHRYLMKELEFVIIY